MYSICIKQVFLGTTVILRSFILDFLISQYCSTYHLWSISIEIQSIQLMFTFKRQILVLIIVFLQGKCERMLLWISEKTQRKPITQLYIIIHQPFWLFKQRIFKFFQSSKRLGFKKTVLSHLKNFYFFAIIPLLCVPN